MDSRQASSPPNTVTYPTADKPAPFAPQLPPRSQNLVPPSNQPQRPPPPPIQSDYKPYESTEMQPQPMQPPPDQPQNNGPPAQHAHHKIMQETQEELTEDELIEYEKGRLTWSKAKNWRYYIRKEWWYWYLIFIVIVVLVGLIAFFHRDIINWLTPFVKKVQSVKDGWLIPVAILFVLSFPPLFGNEVVTVLVGVVWGLGRGFAIAAVGVMLGETVLYFVFRFLCRARAQRMTRKSLNYACLSQAITEGGFLMAWIVRLSVIPTHFTTAVFAICGLKWYHFFAALVLGLPKQLLAVYVGVVLAESNPGTSSHVVSDTVFAASAVITLGALWFIYRRMLSVRKKVIIGMRHDLQAKGVAIPPQATEDAEIDQSRGEDSARGWDRPFNQAAVTEPIQGSMSPPYGAAAGQTKYSTGPVIDQASPQWKDGYGEAEIQPAK